jgi:serine phosphatase RsbU (regulator of sigma subunit)
MTDVAPVLASQPKTKHRSIRTKFLLALLALSLLPLILFVAISRPGIAYVREHVRSQFVRIARENLVRLATDQAAIVSAKLDKVADETRTAAFLVQAVLANPSAFGAARSVCATDEKPDTGAACLYVLPPGLSTAAAQPELELSGDLETMFAFVKKGDPSLDAIYYATLSGVYLQSPWDNWAEHSLAFMLEPAFAQDLDREGEIPEQVWRAFTGDGVALSRHATVSTTEPGAAWLIRDREKNWIFSVRRGKAGLGVYWEYDPRGDPWYKNAVGQDGVVWTKYTNWSGAQFDFELKPGSESQITNKVSKSLARAFADRQIALIENGPISIEQGGKWRVRDKNGVYYEIRAENGKLRVYSIDLLTCSRAVLDPHGRLAGVVGLDIGMHSIGREFIQTPGEIPGYAFVLDERGELIDQETDDMFIPKAGGAIRSKMAAGDSGIAYAADGAADVAFAPIRSIRSPDGKSFWSVGISMPEAEITRLAGETQQRMVFVLELGVGIVFAAMFVPVIFAAVRIAKGITGPIQSLGAGVMRIGSGDLDHRLDVRTRDEIEDLANAFNKMVGDLQTYIKNKEQTESELRMARDIQMSFLKTNFPAFPSRSDFSLYATIEPEIAVGGDLYDFALLDDSRLFFCIGDVCDHGVAASLFMAKTITLMKLASVQPGITPAGILRQVNITLAENNPNSMFVTVFAGILNLETGELAFSNAGHDPPLILGADGGCGFLTLPEGAVLGVYTENDEGSKGYLDVTVRLQPGDMIVTYTDGVTEAMNPKKELYSEARLQQTLTRMAGRSVEDTIAAIFASVKQHADSAPQSDDITVLAVKRN